MEPFLLRKSSHSVPPAQQEWPHTQPPSAFCAGAGPSPPAAQEWPYTQPLAHSRSEHLRRRARRERCLRGSL